ncbi:RHS repeat-associated core domain-containing protein [Clostridium saccharobutylicum]|uniref:tRNA3(Ser)-specific nuclease WapA n=1 Tax=Clostridium saccharobutylicum TaxID=169679 RepID=A0A1S8MQ37_CLOSA|nr:RHS repeat-associated core domain-containing protein [Clostridium saccharobutylicum]OOM06312.1 tRNA3(Ser)-specific nuclease WapA precursor [Clostridium saccharobutylicum]
MQYEYSYNIEGMLETKSASGRTLLRYTYDKNQNIKTIKDITGKSSIYSYDEADRVRLIQDDKDVTLASYDYYKNDSIKSVTVGNGLKTDYTYDGDGNVQSLVTISSNGEVLVDYNYAYDLNGNRLQKISSKHKNFYSYDSMNRLVDSSYDGRCESFTYDKVGNRLTKTISDVANGMTVNVVEKYTYNVRNQLKELHDNFGVNYFTYDKQGNTIKEETETGNNIFEYNTLNQQVKAVTKDGNTLVSRYDTEGLRAEIEENEKLTKFIFHKDNIFVEADKDYNVVSRFSRGYEVVAADIVDLDGESNPEIESKLNRYFYTTDEQGSTIFITDKDQQVKNEYWYDAFGNALGAQEQVHNRITYTGQQFDGVTGQYYLRARFYNPVIGRFTQEDTYRGDGLNLYAYCGNNPVGYYDPSGYLCSTKINQYNDEAKKMGSGRGKYLREKYGKLKPGELDSRINERAGIKFSPRAARSQIKNGGYKTYDIDKYSKAGKGANRAKGYKHIKEDGLVEAHHPIQDEWAKQWKKTTGKKYSSLKAPTILLRTGKGEIHSKISALQNERRSIEGFNTDIVHEFKTGYKELKEAGVNLKDAQKAIREAYRYFDSIGGFNK